MVSGMTEFIIVKFPFYWMTFSLVLHPIMYIILVLFYLLLLLFIFFFFFILSDGLVRLVILNVVINF